MLTLENLKMEFDDRIIFDKVNAAFGDLDRVGIVGNNGAGKTTLVNIISGQLEASSGRAVLDAEHVISVMPQVNYVEGEETLSGGERTKKAVIKAFDRYSNVLILDEPTNHLDYKGIKWLKKRLDDYYGMVIVISHDRYFLDLVCTKILELDHGNGKVYDGNYTSYKEQKELNRKSIQAAYDKQEAYKQEINETINSLSGWSDKGHRESRKKASKQGNRMGAKEKFRKRAEKKDRAIKSRIKRLEKIELEGVKKPEDELEIKFTFGGKHNKINRILSVEEVVMGYDNKQLFESQNFVVNRGERIGILGLNGTGKSTLIKLIRDELKPLSGRVYMNPGLSVGYLSQEVIDLDTNKTVLESMGFVMKERMTIARIQLNNLGIDKDMVHKKIATLSMGERTRVKLAKIILEENDVLILDEPTNHLDIITRETLEQALEKYTGTLLVVSHDYHMLGKLCNRTLLIEEGKLTKINESPTEVM